jgi:hypothetical protein
MYERLKHWTLKHNLGSRSMSVPRFGCSTGVSRLTIGRMRPLVIHPGSLIETRTRTKSIQQQLFREIGFVQSSSLFPYFYQYSNFFIFDNIVQISVTELRISISLDMFY